ncbi:MAG TPA: dephospho-CoA kinase [Actinomycetota bacterium]|nr:dephospho-CoA kinase [Actinomycetota bacterium]
MLLVGLTGGIGAGKSTVASLLARRGAVVFDADQLARQAIDPGTPGYDALIDRFGATIVGPDGSVDREVLGDLVFDDADARRDLEAIVHPEVGRLFREVTEAHRDTDRIVVYDVPLLAETGMADVFDVVVVVQASQAVRSARLAADRGMPEAAVRDRMAAQASDEDRAAIADLVIVNDGDRTALERQVDELWEDLRTRAGIIESP